MFSRAFNCPLLCLRNFSRLNSRYATGKLTGFLFRSGFFPFKLPLYNGKSNGFLVYLDFDTFISTFPNVFKNAFFAKTGEKYVRECVRERIQKRILPGLSFMRHSARHDQKLWQKVWSKPQFLTHKYPQVLENCGKTCG